MKVQLLWLRPPNLLRHLLRHLLCHLLGRTPPALLCRVVHCRR